MLPLYFAVAAAAPCPAPVPIVQVSSALDEALISFALMDQEAFEHAAAAAVESVDCLDQPVGPQLAAAIHRANGIRLLVSGDPSAAVRALAAAADLEPGFVLSENIAPKGGAVATAWEQAKQAPVAVRTAIPPTGEVRIDGTVAQVRPTDRPYVLQVLKGDLVLASRYVTEGWPDLGLPAPVAPAPAPAPVAAAPAAPRPLPPQPPPKRGGKGWLWSSVAAGGVAAGLYGTSAVTRMQYDQQPSAAGHTLINGAYFGSIGTGALAAGLLTTFLVVR